MNPSQDLCNRAKTILSAVISGSVAATLVGGIFKFYLDQEFDEFKHRREHDLAALSQLVGPAVMLLERSRSAAERYSRSGNQYFGDASILNESNTKIRDLLIMNAYLIPPTLIERSQCLITHLDLWLRSYNSELEQFKNSEGRPPQPDEQFDVGFASLTKGATTCGNFPDDVPNLYNQEMKALHSRLFGTEVD